MKSPSASCLLTDNRRFRAFYLMLNLRESKPKNVTLCHVMSAQALEAMGLKRASGYVVTGNNKFHGYLPALYCLVLADFVPESGLSPTVAGVLLSLR